MLKYPTIFLVMLLIVTPVANAQTAEHLEQHAEEVRRNAAKVATTQYLKATEEYFSRIEKADFDETNALDAALIESMKEGNLDLANRVAAKKKEVIERAALEKARDERILPKNSSTRVLGDLTTGKRVVFLCQASGSMLTSFNYLRQQLKVVINNLDDDGDIQFDIIVFQDGDFSEVFTDGLRAASAANKELARRFIDTADCSGGDNPIPAIAEAIKLKPTDIFIFSDGFSTVTDKPALVDFFKTQNSDLKAALHVDSFSIVANPYYEECMRKIAQTANGGTYRKVEIPERFR